MKITKYLALVPSTFLLINIAQAAGNEIFYQVPFHNVEVKAASKIYVEYTFNSHKQTLVCSCDQQNQAITSAEWVYKGATRKIDLPVTLKDDQNFEGYYADPDGTLTITNEFGSKNSGSIYVTCEYRNMN